MTDRAPAYRDRLPAPVLPEGERQIALFRVDRDRYVRDHLALAAVGGVLVVAVLLMLARGPVLWAGIAGVLAALVLRALWFWPEARDARWLLTDRAVIAPGQDRYEIADITALRRLMGDVQIVTRGRRKLLIRHQADPAAVIAQIEAAR